MKLLIEFIKFSKDEMSYNNLSLLEKLSFWGNIPRGYKQYKLIINALNYEV